LYKISKHKKAEKSEFNYESVNIIKINNKHTHNLLLRPANRVALGYQCEPAIKT